ncbi:MAG: hypothetical protein LUH02_01205 [Erysipelotrichaceae bacterium]|nr:hypothetical protein [Erysipelotrichaceae bacterium]
MNWNPEKITVAQLIDTFMSLEDDTIIQFMRFGKGLEEIPINAIPIQKLKFGDDETLKYRDFKIQYWYITKVATDFNESNIVSEIVIYLF